MQKYIYILILVIAALLLVWTLMSYLVERSVKTPAYTVVGQREGYEVRAYAPYIVAETEVEGTYEGSLNEGFRILADYIFGNNTAQTGIAMTAPVTERQSQTLAMTAPVMERANAENRIISFVMPFEYTLETLPMPNNPKVRIVPQEARKVAVLRFSWFRDSARVAEKKQTLLSLLERDGAVVIGVPEYAGYNAPFTAPWLTRNEVMVEIE